MNFPLTKVNNPKSKECKYYGKVLLVGVVDYFRGYLKLEISPPTEFTPMNGVV